MKMLIVLTLLLAIATPALQAKSEFLEDFMDKYNSLMTDLSRKPYAEYCEVENLVYKKDRAVFTFASGKFYLLRYVDERPTTAIFIGEGNCTMEVPIHAERVSLVRASRDSTVDEDFETCFIRFTDDFDLRLREKFEVVESELPWREFNVSAQSQGEYYFAPQRWHQYDNLFQLLRSAYERTEDGYFWVDFNRYVFTFDPNRPEQVILAYEYEGADEVATQGAVLQREERNIDEDSELSQIVYPSTMVSREGEIALRGLDGKYIDEARIDMDVVINRDSLRFMSLFLHYNLNLDSLYVDGAPVDYHRRGSFSFLGVILPEYRYKDDTVSFTFFYHGKDYGPPLPFVADPTPSTVALEFAIPSGYNVLAPAMSDYQPDDGKWRFTTEPQEKYFNYQFQPYAAGFDTVATTSAVGLQVNIVRSEAINKRDFNCYVPDEIYDPAVMGAIDFMTARLGTPPATFQLWVYPDSQITAPGIMEVTKVHCLVDGTGGIEMKAGKAAAQQWFGALVKPKTDREYWITDGVSDYLSLMHVAQVKGTGIFFGELMRRRSFLYTVCDQNEDWPLAAGDRVGVTLRTAKGTWIMHMLRYLMYDVENPSSRQFLKFVHELSQILNNTQMSNVDFIALAEEHYGESLDWFFHHWLYDRDIPDYKVEYAMVQGNGGWYVNGEVRTERVGPEFRMPVIMRVEEENGNSTYVREWIEGSSDDFALGPFPEKPKKFVFNELFSVLAKQDVNEK